jgi:hypothetical protein
MKQSMVGQAGSALGSVLRAAALVGVCAGAALPMASWAQATRTWVSGVGDDVNACSRTAPCKTFAGAIAKTAAGGEINALDGGSFGTVTITKSITIDGGGAMTSVLASATNGININAGVGDDVVLRNLSINGATPIGLSGINVLQARSVRIQNVQVENFSVAALNVNTTGSGPGVMVDVLNSVFSRSAVGVKVSAAATQASPTTLSIQRSSLVFNKKSSGTGSTTDPATEGAGIWVSGANARANLSNSTVYGNAIGMAATGTGQIGSYGNNATQGNTQSGSFTATVSNN